MAGVRDFEQRYDKTLQDYTDCDNPAEVLKAFFVTHREKKIYLLIDEYDHFANEILSFHFDHFSDINPDMVLYLFTTWHQEEEYPEKLIDLNIASDYGNYIQSEQESEQKYVDVLFLYRPPYFPTYQFAFELKYLKKSESDQLETTVQKATAQLQGYLQSEALQHLKNLKTYVIVFVGSEAKAVEAMEL